MAMQFLLNGRPVRTPLMRAALGVLGLLVLLAVVIVVIVPLLGAMLAIAGAIALAVVGARVYFALRGRRKQSLLASEDDFSIIDSRPRLPRSDDRNP